MSLSADGGVSAVSAVRSSVVPAGYTGIYTAADLDNIRNNTDADGNIVGKYILMNDIDLSGYSNWNPIGGSGSDFKGVFDGNGYSIKNLKIDRNDQDHIGLFGSVDEADIKNVSLKNVNIKGKNYTGGLIGYATWTTINNCSTTGTIQGYDYVGGLIGKAGASETTNSFSKCNLNVNSDAGGLIGHNDYSKVSCSFATGNIVVPNSYSNPYCGFIGGFVGENSYEAEISDCYATGSITGGEIYAGGGFVGMNLDKSIIKNSYSTGKVTGYDDIDRFAQIAGFAGHNLSESKITNSFYDIQKSGQSDGTYYNDYQCTSDVTGLTTAEMARQAYYIDAGWTSDNWDLSSAPPVLNWEKTIPPEPSPAPSGGSIGALRLQVGTDSSDSSCIHVDLAFDLGSFSLDFSSADSCVSAIDEIDGLLNTIGKKMSDFGAVLNRLDSVLSSQVSTIENLTASKSTITDADIAKESAEFVKNQILQQTTSALLVQAQSAHSSVIRALIQ